MKCKIGENHLYGPLEHLRYRCHYLSLRLPRLFGQQLGYRQHRSDCLCPIWIRVCIRNGMIRLHWHKSVGKNRCQHFSILKHSIPLGVVENCDTSTSKYCRKSRGEFCSTSIPLWAVESLFPYPKFPKKHRDKIVTFPFKNKFINKLLRKQK